MLARLDSLVRWWGRTTIDTALYLVDLTVFILLALRAWRGWHSLSLRSTRMTIVNQIIFTGVDALPVILLLGLAVGISMTAQLLNLAVDFGTDKEMVDLVATIIGMELGSLITAIVLIGRSGSAIVVDLGNMKLHKEVEGLELLGIDINDMIVAPRLIGASVSQMALSVFFAGVATFGGVAAAGLLLSSSYFRLITPLMSAFTPAQILVFLLKNLLFGLIIAGTSCFHALKVGVSPTEVPQQTQRAIVNGLLLVFILDGMFALALAFA
jgi:phospholipid/cholesterol/gamma-HCH transport system permease protein